MDRTTSSCNVGTFCRLFSAKERRTVLKGKPDGNLQVYFFSVHEIGAACDVPIASFYSHMFDSNMEQGTDGLCLLREPMLQ